MTSIHDGSGTVSPGQHRRCRTMAEKLRLIQQTFQPETSVGRVARRNGIDHHLLRRWRRLESRGLLGNAAQLRCTICGEPCDATRSDAKFCSSKCRQKAYPCAGHRNGRLRRMASPTAPFCART